MSMEFFRKTLDMLTQVNEDSSSASESEQLNESGYTGKGNHKPGWMRRADPALDKKLRDREKANRPPLPVPSEKKLDELSPATLGSYVKKASHEVGYHGGEEGRAAERRDRSTERQHSFKREKRQRGIGQAVGKMVGGPVDEGYLAEGTWSLPETPEAQKKLAALLSSPLTASVATKVLYNLIGDDTLFDRLGDAREWMDKEGIPAERQIVNDVVIDWMKKNSDMPGVSETLAMLKGVSEAPQIGMLEKNAMKESITIGSVVKIETAPGTLARARVMAINEGQYTVATGSGTEYTVDYDDLWVKTRKLTESVDLDAWSQEYDENEEYNHHTENVLLVAELVGSPEDVAAVKKILQLRDRQGYLTSEQATAGYEIQSRLWPKVKQLFTQQHAGKTMHESWFKTRKLTESVDLDAWAQEYDDNEENNYHTENVLMVAELVGTDKDIEVIKKIMAERDRKGYLDHDLYDVLSNINRRLWPKVKQLFTQQHAGKTMHESWDDEEDDDVRRADDELRKMGKKIEPAKINTDKDKIKRTARDREEELDEAMSDLQRSVAQARANSVMANRRKRVSQSGTHNEKVDQRRDDRDEAKRNKRKSEELDEADLVGLGEKSRAAKMPRGPVVEAETCCTVKYKMQKSDPEISVAEYDSREAAERFLASIKAKGGNGIISSKKKIDELSKDTLTSYIKKASKGAQDFSDVPDERKAGVTTALKKKHDMGAKIAATEAVDSQEARRKVELLQMTESLALRIENLAKKLK